MQSGLTSTRDGAWRRGVALEARARMVMVFVLVMGVGVTTAPPSAAAEPDSDREPFMGVVPRPEECVGEDDNPELDSPLQLQGQVPWAARLSGLAAEGYRCNLELVANIDGSVDDMSYGNAAFANFDVYEDCAYYSIGNSPEVGMAVVDVSDSENPERTTVLHTPGVGAPWESLRVNLARGLLAGSPSGSPALDIYSVAEDCRDPQLLSSTEMPTGRGHEGWFQPDGNVYYVAPVGDITAVDVSDPTSPKELGTWGQSHGGSTSLDGTRTYACQTSPNAVTIWDTSAIARGEPDDSPELVSTTPIENGSTCQQTMPVFYDGRPYVLQMGELGPGGLVGPRCNGGDLSNFSPPHIVDVSDERNPFIAARLMNEVNDPANCELVAGDRSEPVGLANDNFFAYALFVYGSHMCTPDRIYDPTILACAEFLSGIRVYDIRDPYAPTELAYFNWGTLAPGITTVEMHPARPVVRPDKGEIWFVGAYTGFSVLRFADGVYPFPETLECPEEYDYLLDQYSTLCPSDPAQLPEAPTAPVIERVAGSDRISTAVEVSKATYETADTVVIARADEFADALAGAPLARQLDAPALLTGSDGVAPQVEAEIDRLGASRAVLLGGEAALEPAVADRLREGGITVERVFGSNRFGTAAQIAQRMGGDFDEVFLTEGIHPHPARGWPDAMSGAPYAAFTGRPVLLTAQGLLPPETQEALDDTSPDETIVVGGHAAVGDAVVDQVRAQGYNPRRLAGANRFETSAAVYAEGVEAGMDQSTLWVATGLNWPDALTGGAAAGARGETLLLVAGDDLANSPSSRELIEANRDAIEQVNLLGGDAAISTLVADQIADALADRPTTATAAVGTASRSNSGPGTPLSPDVALLLAGLALLPAAAVHGRRRRRAGAPAPA